MLIKKNNYTLKKYCKSIANIFPLKHCIAIFVVRYLNKYKSQTKMRRSVAIFTILIYAFTCANNAHANGNYEALNISCPEEKNVYMCEPLAEPVPMKFEDFNAISADEISFEINESLSNFKKYKVTQYEYIFKDAYGNEIICIQKYYIPNEDIQPPSLSKTINICQNNSFTLIDKPYEDNYIFYEDNKGNIGKQVSSCENSDIWCLASDLGLNTSKSGTYTFWVTNVLKERSSSIEDKAGFWCESEPVLITMEVNSKPTAVLKKDLVTMKMGEFLNLMDMVEENKEGVWKGNDIISFKSITDHQHFYYFPLKSGLHKLYYMVDNDACKSTYTMLIEVFSARKSADVTIDDFTVFPNPSKGNVFVNLSNSLDVEHTISVFDIAGKKQINLSVSDVKNTIFDLDLTHLSKGVYLVEVRNPFNVSTKKLMLE